MRRVRVSLPPLPLDHGDTIAWERWLDLAFVEQPDRVLHLRRSHAAAITLRATGMFSSDSQADLELAALLHDIGRALDPTDALPHALSGAVMLEACGLGRISSLVANHTGSAAELDDRGFGREIIACWPIENRALQDVMDWIDATSGPRGQVMSPRERAAEITIRYGENSRQTRIFHALLPAILETDRSLRLRIEHADAKQRE